MEHIQMIKGLERKADEIEVLLAEYLKLIERLQANLVHLRATIALMRTPTESISAPIMSVARIFRRGEVYERCVALLKTSGELDTTELAVACMKAKDLDPSDRTLRRAMAQQVIQVLAIRAKDGRVVKAGKRGVTRVWKLGAGTEACERGLKHVVG